MFMMRFVLPILLLLLSSLNSCQKTDEVMIEGVQSVDLPKRCFNISETQIVIDDSTAYVEHILDKKIANDSCNGYESPSIDFSENTLLGQLSDAVGCSLSYTREVFANSQDHTYTYKVIVSITDNSNCETTQQTHMNWISLPKVPDNYEVLFEVVYESNP